MFIQMVVPGQHEASWEAGRCTHRTELKTSPPLPPFKFEAAPRSLDANTHLVLPERAPPCRGISAFDIVVMGFVMGQSFPVRCCVYIIYVHVST